MDSIMINIVYKLNLTRIYVDPETTLSTVVKYACKYFKIDNGFLYNTDDLNELADNYNNKYLRLIEYGG